MGAWDGQCQLVVEDARRLHFSNHLEAGEAPNFLGKAKRTQQTQGMLF